MAAQGTLCTVPCRQVPHGDAARLWARLRRHDHDSGRSVSGGARGGAAQVQCRCGPPSCTRRACAALDRRNAQLLCRARSRRLALPGSMPRQSRCSAARMVKRQSCVVVLLQLGEFFSFLRDTKFFQHTKARPDRIAVVSSGADGGAVAQQMRLRWRLHEWNWVEYSSLIRAGDGAEGDPDLRALELRGGGRRLGRLGF